MGIFDRLFVGKTPKRSPVVVFRGADGRTLTLEELRRLTGTFRYEIVGASNVPAEAESLHRQARQAGAAGEHQKALTLLEQSAKLAPRWPYPVYDMAYTYLLMNDRENARKHYRKTLELAPRGYFTAITALESLDREAKGELPDGTYLAYVSLEWMHDPAKKGEAVRQLVERVPTFAPGWVALGSLSHDVDERLKATERGLAANPDAETKGMLQINKALLQNRKGDHDGAVRLLGELALDPASTWATEHLAKVALANVVAAAAESRSPRSWREP